ncbi:MAG: AAA family ATPase [Melioribacteraceae bacterium]|nr:AAA family ATPase [Melioribacteraceae bacterium]
MGFFTGDQDLNKLQQEAFDHLWNGRFRIALPIAEKLFLSRPDDSDAAICYAWALLENGNPIKALELANLAVELKGDSTKARVYRAYLLSRMSIFEGAIADLDIAIEKEKDELAWSYLNKARSLAGLQKFDDANHLLDLALIIDDYNHKNWKELKYFLEKANEIKSLDISKEKEKIPSLIELSNQAIKSKEYWFSLFTARKILEVEENPNAEIIELESMLYLFQIKPALKKAENIKSKFSNNDLFNKVYSLIKKFSELEQEDDYTFDKKKKKNKTKFTTQIDESISFITESKFYPNEYVDIFSIKIFNVEEEQTTNNRIYYSQFDFNTKTFGAEVIFNNLFYNKSDKIFDATAIWYFNDFEVYKNNFKINIKKEWDSVIFVQTFNKSKIDFKKGQAKVEFYINNFKVGEKYFIINSQSIPEEEKVTSNSISQDEEKPKTKTFTKREVRPLNELIDELNSFTGLSSIKEAIKNFIAYLEFIKERKKLGLKADENISVNAVFLGNPGTGKTTIARMLGDIFYAMGILPSGHVVEVDRAALVGEYVGQTAQKTEKKINEAIGGVLFIDEAYTLVKQGASNDFGQEAIDILLKRMEDRKGEFVVIVAGYPDEMNLFLNSNPGLKSRFTHTFVFEDYSPDELIEIFEKMIIKEDYVITENAKEILKKELINIYRKRDKSFGNARLIKRLYENCKINLSKICLQLKEEERTREALTTFTEEVILQSFSKSKTKEVRISINEEILSEALKELENLVGLKNIKKEIDNMVKLARYLHEQGEDLSKIYSEHILFLGNPGTGKTSVARIFGKIYSALGILPKGHLVETDRQGLVAGFVGQTAEKTTRIIDLAIGGMLFIDEAYSLIKPNDSGSDFGKEAIDILLKRMEDDRGKFIVVAAGYTDEMNKFISANPGIKSRFSKSFIFEDYTPAELLEIVHRSLNKENKKLNTEAEKLLLKHFELIYKNRDKKFGNARIVRNILEAIKQKTLLRLAETPSNQRNDENILTIETEDIQEVLSREVEAKSYQVKGDPLKLQDEINELNNLVGLENVKQEIFKLISFAKISKLKKEQGLESPERNLNSIFIGNNGVGKRTIAKLLGKILKELGTLEKGHVLEVDRKDFIASYQGQTEINTNKILQQAFGGILYIKDATSLFQNDEYSKEAVDTLLKGIEYYKGKLILILADKKFNFEKIISHNSKLKSLLPNIFYFEDYSPRQLLAIAFSLAEKNGYILDEGALQELMDLFIDIYNTRDQNFDNGNFAKHILFKAITNQEERIFSIYEKEDVDLKTITLEDVEKIRDTLK